MKEDMPCKEIRCLKYPICKSLNTISCDILLEVYANLMNENKGLANQTSKTWGSLRMTLPHLFTVKGTLMRDKFGQYTVKSKSYPMRDFTEDMIWATIKR